jgi:hypothetical protein
MVMFNDELDVNRALEPDIGTEVGRSGITPLIHVEGDLWIRGHPLGERTDIVLVVGRHDDDHVCLPLCARGVYGTTRRISCCE